MLKEIWMLAHRPWTKCTDTHSDDTNDTMIKKRDDVTLALGTQSDDSDDQNDDIA